MKNILMNTEMTRAMLNGSKTNTRRPIKLKKFGEIAGADDEHLKVTVNNRIMIENYKIPFEKIIDAYAKYKKDEVIWVREPARITRFDDIISQVDFKYKADDKRVYQFKIPKRFEAKNKYDVKAWLKNCQGIPNGCIKEMARIFLKITDVRIERLQDISDEDCIAEGIEERWGLYKDYKDNEKGFIKDKKYDFIGKTFSGLKMSFFTLISSINGEKFLQSNPYVFVYEFKRVNNDGSELWTKQFNVHTVKSM